MNCMSCPKEATHFYRWHLNGPFELYHKCDRHFEKTLAVHKFTNQAMIELSHDDPEVVCYEVMML